MGNLGRAAGEVAAGGIDNSLPWQAVVFVVVVLAAVAVGAFILRMYLFRR